MLSDLKKISVNFLFFYFKILIYFLILWVAQLGNFFIFFSILWVAQLGKEIYVAKINKLLIKSHTPKIVTFSAFRFIKDFNQFYYYYYYYYYYKRSFFFLSLCHEYYQYFQVSTKDYNSY